MYTSFVFFYKTVGRFICFTVLCKVLKSGCRWSPWVTFTKIVRECACRAWKSDFLYNNFLPSFPPISIPYLKEKYPILTKLGAFCNILPQIAPYPTPNLCNLGSFVSDETPPPSITIPNFAEKRPKKHDRYTMSMWEPPPTHEDSVHRTQKKALLLCSSHFVFYW